jgi:hypothetical protein
MDSSGRLGFEAESFDRCLVGYELRLEHLDRELGVEVDVRGAVDISHATYPDEAVQMVAPVEQRPNQSVNLDKRAPVTQAEGEIAWVSIAARITLLEFVHAFFGPILNHLDVRQGG